MHLPTISVKDKANKYVKTDLARTNVTSFKLELSFVRNIYKYFIAQILFRKFELCDIEYPWFHFYKGKMPLAISDKGFTVLARSFVLNTEKDVICFFGRFKNFEKLDVNHGMLKSGFCSMKHRRCQDTDFALPVAVLTSSVPYAMEWLMGTKFPIALNI